MFLPLFFRTVMTLPVVAGGETAVVLCHRISFTRVTGIHERDDRMKRHTCTAGDDSSRGTFLCLFSPILAAVAHPDSCLILQNLHEDAGEYACVNMCDWEAKGRAKKGMTGKEEAMLQE